MAEEEQPKKKYKLTEEQRERKRHGEQQRRLRMTDEERARIREQRRIAQQQRRLMVAEKHREEQREVRKQASSHEEKDSENGSGDAHSLTGSSVGDDQVDCSGLGEHSEGSIITNSTCLYKGQDQGSTYLDANSGAKNNGPPYQVSIRLTWIKRQIRSGNIELAKRAIAMKSMGWDQFEQHLETDRSKEDALSIGVVEPIRSMPSLNAKRLARKGNTLPSENVD